MNTFYFQSTDGAIQHAELLPHLFRFRVQMSLRRTRLLIYGFSLIQWLSGCDYCCDTYSLVVDTIPKFMIGTTTTATTTVLWPTVRDYPGEQVPGQTMLDFAEADMMGWQCISWTICKLFALRSRRQPRQYFISQIFTGRMPFLTPNQQRQSTEGTPKHWRHRIRDRKQLRKYVMPSTWAVGHSYSASVPSPFFVTDVTAGCLRQHV